jgi:hypothetical protein
MLQVVKNRIVGKHRISSGSRTLLCQNNVFIVNYYFTVWSVVAGGRKCNFEGCDKPQFKPTIENGWYWASTGNINIKNRVT